MRWWHIDPVLSLEERLFPEDAWSAGMFWSELAHARGSARTRHYVVALRPDGKLAGYAGLAAAGQSADVQTIAAAPELHGTGLGTRLLRELLDAATAFGSQEVFLEVRTDNEPAQRLYRRHGFEPLGVRKNYYQAAGMDALVMRRDNTRQPPGPAPAGHRPPA
ncbi:ribosomal protein S18-alanine N-acetyltransferase [Streptomyces spiramenti]|uniref:Ribosomal protein S18-alanine N-acetyltransferase n=1 Tax=Streptomyces spiramenti TaxID=2720606 RepID=A0ABX1AR44_9ACTN|nr:ribosomal protein S18-alanine N-acetyltransferase [Streptomyces spiramenti]NJP68626.1 ribosomal protein S18-alanine N-acetyltransferase [Streptomyces spiramenti]